MFFLTLFVFGAVVGSFLNVVAERWDSFNFGGRSMCPHCYKILFWYELIPIISFVIQRAKCRGCHNKISWQYPIIEIWMGLIFLSIYNLQFTIYKEFSSSFMIHSFLLLIIFSIYIVIAIYDFKHKIIPDELVYTAILLSLLGSIFFNHHSLLDWFAGPIIFVFFASIWFFSRGRAMGFGDAKLGLSVGLLLGAFYGFSAIALSFWIGAIVSLAHIFLGHLSAYLSKTSFLKNAKKLTIKSEVPFAPFIIIGAWFSLIFHLNIFNVVLF